MVAGIDFGTAEISVAILDGKKRKVLLDRYGKTRHTLTPEDGQRTSLHDAEQILKKAGILIREQTGCCTDTACIAVPARMSGAQRMNIVEAGRKSGFRYVRIVNQAEAAAFSLGSEVSGKVLVLDFGETRLEVALVEVHKGAADLKRAISDDSLGGKRFTRDMSVLLQEKAGYISGNPADYAKAFKIGLSSAAEFTRQLQGVPVTVQRREYEKILGRRISRIREIIRQLLRSCGIRAAEIDTVLMTGGGSRIPCVQKIVRQIFTDTVPVRICPAEAAALGAADLFSRKSTPEKRVMTVSPSDFGLEIDVGKAFWMLKKDRPLPASAEKSFTTIREGQNNIEVHVIRKEGEVSKGVSSLSRLLLPQLSETLHGRPKFDIQFLLNPDGYLTVTVKGPWGRISETIRTRCSISTQQKSGEKPCDFDSLISRVEQEYRGRRFFIDSELAEDISGILKIARRGRKTRDPGLKRECSIALWSLLEEIRSLEAGREADCAG